MLRGQSTVSFTLHSCLLWANGIFAIPKTGKLAGLRNVRGVRHLACSGDRTYHLEYAPKWDLAIVNKQEALHPKPGLLDKLFKTPQDK